MANKNRAGNVVANWQRRENRLIEKMDEREKSSKNVDNVDPIYNKYELKDDGSKVWSF